MVGLSAELPWLKLPQLATAHPLTIMAVQWCWRFRLASPPPPKPTNAT